LYVEAGSMEDKYSEITKLKGLVKQLINIIDAKELQLEQLRSNYNRLKEETDEKNNLITELKEKTDTLKIAKSFSLSEDDKTDVKNKINKIVREIDKSIGLLNE
jgi:chromosome segregation ATPase